MYICMTGSLCCTAEIGPMLKISCTLIKKNFKNKKAHCENGGCVRCRANYFPNSV